MDSLVQSYFSPPSLGLLSIRIGQISLEPVTSGAAASEGERAAVSEEGGAVPPR